MKDGLQLSMWMVVASLVWLLAVVAWPAPTVYAPRAGILLAALLVTTLLTRSTGALLLFVVGIAALVSAKTTRSRLPIIALLLVPPVFIGVRTTGEFGWEPMVDAARLMSDDRARSLEGRFVNEDLLMTKAFQRPMFGWGGWGRNRVYDEYGKDLTVTDGRWIIELGQRGFVGLLSLFALLLLPLSAPCRQLSLAATFRRRARRAACTRCGRRAVRDRLPAEQHADASVHGGCRCGGRYATAAN